MIHPDRKCKMYLDFAIKKHAESGSSTSLEVKRKVTQEDNNFLKPPKAAKPKKGASGPSAKDSNAVEGRSLSDKQKAKLVTLQTNIQDELRKCDEMSAKIAGDTEFAEFLPEKVTNNNNNSNINKEYNHDNHNLDEAMTSFNLAVATLREQAAALDLALETQMTDDYGNIVKEASGAIGGAAKAMKQINLIKKAM